MNRKSILILMASALFLLAACDPKPVDPVGPDGPDGPDVPASEITTDNAAPAGFSDEGPMSWDE